MTASRHSGLALAARAVGTPRPWPRLWGGRALEPAYDVVVVGAGGHGLAIAYHLARDHGVGRVAVLERGLLGLGNVGRNTTIVRSNYLLPENQHFYEDALRRWERLARDLDYNVMYSPRGVIDLATSDGEVDALARRGNAMRLAGIDAELLDARDLARLVPALQVGHARRFPIIGGLLQPRGGTVRHDAVAWGYGRAASALGVQIVEGCEVLGLETAAGRAVGVRTNRGAVRCERVVFAVAGRTAAVGAMLGRKLPIETHRLQAVVTEPVRPVLDTVLVYFYGDAETYVTQSDRGGLVMGGQLDGYPATRDEGEWHRLEEIVQGALAMLPGIGGLRVLRHWAGINDMTMDGSPIVDRIGFDNVFLTGGWCYGGFKAIPASGAACAQFVATGVPPDLIRPFRLDRFATGHLLDEKGAGPFPVRQ